MNATPDSHVPSARALLSTLLALLLLTALSWGLTYVSLGSLGTVVALGIATLKAVCVALFFMDVAHKGLSIRLTAVVTFSFIALICLGVGGDIAFR